MPAPPWRRALPLLPPDVRRDLAASPRTWRTSGPARDPQRELSRTVWHAGVWSRLGRIDHAVALLDGAALRRSDPARGAAPDVTAWVAAERGRLLRELGLHAAAEALEAPALVADLAPATAALLLVGLTADAVGVGDAVGAEARFAAAVEATRWTGEAAAVPVAARARLRLGWVALEVALLTGRPVDEVRALAAEAGVRLPEPPGAGRTEASTARRARGGDLDHGSRAHRAKALLFAGVERSDPLLVGAAVRLAPPMLRWAALLAAADLAAGRGDGPLAARAEADARRAWRSLRLPQELTRDVARTPVGARLGAPGWVRDPQRGASGGRPDRPGG